MMRIDAFNHFFPAGYFKKMTEVGSDLKDIASRARAIKSIHDLDTRLRVVEQFPDYAQILSLPAPTLETLSQGRPEVALDLAKAGNDGLAELVAKHPRHFPGFLAQVPLTAGDAGAAEAERAIKDLGAAGVQIYTNVGGKPLDRPEFEGFFAAMNKIGKPIWIHPERGANRPDYADEQKSLYEIWWTFGWPYETSVAMARIVFAGLFDKHPAIKIITHHYGAMIPFFEGRIGPGLDQLGARTTGFDKSSIGIRNRPFDYFKMFYADTAVFGSRAATECGLAFFGADKTVFASDAPFDPEKGPMYIRETIKVIESLGLPQADLEKIFHGNAERLLKLDQKSLTAKAA